VLVSAVRPLRDVNVMPGGDPPGELLGWHAELFGCCPAVEDDDADRVAPQRGLPSTGVVK